jgi:hypothetical protein
MDCMSWVSARFFLICFHHGDLPEGVDMASVLLLIFVHQGVNLLSKSRSLSELAIS